MLHRRETPNPEQVIETLNNSGLREASPLIMGSGVLALLGIDYARDVDVMISHQAHKELKWSGMTPSGLIVEPKPGSKHDFFHTLPSDPQPLGLDIAPAYVSHNANPMLDKEYQEFRSQLHTYDGYPYLTLDHVRTHMQHVGGRKNRHHIQLIDIYSKHQKV